MRTSGTLTAGLVASLGLFGGASAAVVDARQSCPAIHVFGARETTVSPGYGSAAGLVNAIRSAFPGATSEAITYPACGGQASCGNIAYGDSVRAGTQAVATAVNSFNQRCPDTKIVVVGYSQGGQIFDNAYCGGTDPGAGISTTASPLTASARAAIKAAILFGNPRYRAGLPYNVGTCTAQGFAPREQGFTCQGGDKIKNYCDSPDPYCCNGNNQAVHQGYQGVYGQQALAFVTAQLNAGGGTTPSPPTPPTTPPTTPPPTTPPGGACAAQWAQCGGNGFTGPTCCQAPATCRVVNAWYHQCLS